MVYRGRRDAWALLAIPLILAMLGGGGWLLYTSFELGNAPGMVVIQFHREPYEMAIGAILVVFGLVLLWSMTSVRYQLCEPALMVMSGPDRQFVPLSDIVEVVPTQNPLSCGLPRSPIWSRKLLCVTHREPGGRGTRKMVIAPADRDAFLQELQKCAPHLRANADNGALSCGSGHAPAVT